MFSFSIFGLTTLLACLTCRSLLIVERRHCEQRLAAWAALFLALTMISAPSVNAQTGGPGALEGTVTDPSGAVVPNAKVTAISADTSQSRTTATAGDGTYDIGLLPPGNYRLMIEATGFKVTEISAVKVNVTETTVLDSTLELGA